MERMVWPTVQVGTVGIVSRGGQLHSGTIIATEANCASFSSAANIVAAVALATAAIAGCNTSSTTKALRPPTLPLPLLATPVPLRSVLPLLLLSSWLSPLAVLPLMRVLYVCIFRMCEFTK